MHTRYRTCSVLHTALILCIAVCGSRSFAQQELNADSEFAAQAEVLKLEPVFADDFRCDSRADYAKEGNVGWEPGALTLGEGASIGRKINGGPWIRIELNVDWPAPTAARPESEMRIWLKVDGATNCCIRLRAVLQDGKNAGSVALVLTGAPDGQSAEKVVREVDVPIVRGDLAIEYRHGLVSVLLGSDGNFVTFIENGSAAVAATRLEVVKPATVVRQFTVATHRSISRELSAKQKLELAKAESANSELVSLHRGGKYVEAVKLGEQVLEVRRRVLGTDHPDYAQSLNNLALLHQLTGDYARAKPLFVEACDTYNHILGSDHPQRVLCLNNLALLYLDQGDYFRAEPLLVEAHNIRQRVQGTDDPTYAMSLNNLAALYKVMGEYARAEPLFLESSNLYKRILGGNHPAYATSLNNLAELYKSLSEYARSESLLAESLAIRRRVLGTNHPLYAVSLNNLGLLHRYLGENARAEPLLVEAHEVTKRVLGTEHPKYATSLNNLAELYRSLGDNARAERMHSEAREIRRRVLGTDHRDYAGSLNNLAGLYRSQGEYARAESLLEEARDITKRVLGTDHRDFAACLNNLALLYQSVGEYVRAEPLYVQALEIKKRVLVTEHPDYANSLNNLAGLCRLMGESTRAQPLFQEAHGVLLAAATKTLPSLSEAQAINWKARNQPRTDLVVAGLRRREQFDVQVAYQVVWQTKFLTSRLHVARTLPTDAAPAAQEVFAQLRDARLKLAKVVSATPSPQQAEGYRRALAAANDRKETLERKLAKLSLTTERALAVRDATIDDLLAHLPPGVAVVDFVLLDDWTFVDTEIALTKEDGSTETRTLKREKPTPVFDAFILRSDRASDQRVAWVPLGEAKLIEEATAQWRQQLPRRQDARSLGGESGLVKSGSDAGSHEQRDSGILLRQLVWDQLEPHLAGCHTVILLPDGSLHRLPWAALPGREPGCYLIEDYALATASYGQQLFGLLSDEPVSGNEELLVAGGIQYDQRGITIQRQPPSASVPPAARSVDLSAKDRQWAYLTGAEEEARAVTELWAGRSPAVLLSGTAADERTLAQALTHARYAHLATHGFFDTSANVYRVDLRKQSLFETSFGGQRQATLAARNPLLMTGIVLAGANLQPQKNELGIPTHDDGILTAEEIVGLDLCRTELVTLSACETGLGDVAAGEGVMGLQRALHQAGARSVIASLWKVSDGATRALMTEFYRNLWTRQLSKLESLRQAQLTMMRHYDLKTGQLRGLGLPSAAIDGQEPIPSPSHRLPPQNWAAFQLSGDWR